MMGERSCCHQKCAESSAPFLPRALSSNKFLSAFWGKQMLAQKLYNLTLLRNGALAIRDVLWCWWPPYNPPPLLTLDATANASTAKEDPRISIRSRSKLTSHNPPNSPEKSINSITTAPNKAQKSDMQITSNDLRVHRSGRDDARWFHYPVVWIELHSGKWFSEWGKIYPFLKQIPLSQLD